MIFWRIFRKYCWLFKAVCIIFIRLKIHLANKGSNFTRLKIRHCDQKTNSYIYIYFSSFYIWLFVKSAKRMMAWLAYAIESPENIKLLPDKLYVAMWYTVSAQIRGHSWLDRHYFKILIGRHFFWQKVPFSRLLGQNCNRPPPYNPNLFISLRPLICADRVCLRHLLIIDHFFCQYLHFEIQIITEWGYRWLHLYSRRVSKS